MASFSVVSNIASANAQANLQVSQLGLNKALGRLSSGYRITMAGDDAAGLAVANTYRNEIAVLNQGIRNANDGLSQLQIKDGAVNNISQLLDRLATLATQGASVSSNGIDLSTLKAEFDAILSEIDRQATVAGLDGGATATDFSVFVSSEAVTADGVVSGTIGNVDTTALGLDGVSASWSGADDAVADLELVKAAVTAVGAVQNDIGILQNRLQFAIGLAQAQSVNTKAAESRIRDANIAEEAANMTRYNILSQSGISALAQANQTSASVLALLR